MAWRAVAALSLAAAAVAAGACEPSRRTDSRVWTLFDIQAALRSNETIAAGPTLGAGIPASAVLTPLADGSATLRVSPAFVEGRPAAFVTTELWINFSQSAWIQPVYAQVTDGAGTPLADPVAGAAPLLIDVGPRSHFYSPFWRLDLAMVGPLAGANHYRSTRELFRDGVPIQEGGSRTCPLRPLDVLPAPPGGHLTEPTWQTVLDDIPAAEAWLDGEKLGLFDFGPGIVDEHDAGGATGLTEPLPFFQFVAADATGALAPIDAYRVGAVGPLLSGKPAEVAIDAATGWPKPRFGGYWRVFLAVLPAGAGAFHGAEHAAARDAAAAAGVDPLELEGRVAHDAACFDDGRFPAACDWLDSQAKIEARLGAARLLPTEITGTCPLVFYDKKPVKR